MLKATESLTGSPLISVITPVYNGERFIGSCLDVVIEQDCANIEHIIVDGGSTDGTLRVIQEYAAKYSHIRWVSEPDRGQSDAMNKGIALARGQIIGFLNVDDYYEPGVLRRVLQHFKTLPEPSFVAGNCNIWQDDGRYGGINKPAKLEFTELLLGFHVNPFPMNPSAYFYHRSLHQKAGLYKVDEHYAMDIEFILRAVQVATVKYVDETWGNYRMIEGSKTVNDFKSGQGKDRVGEILKTYRANLTGFQKFKVNSTYKFHKSLYETRWFLIRRRDQAKAFWKEWTGVKSAV